ncbi:MAG: intracellular septation protein A [Burkholderia gladioli]|nr:MAG: intracellular septation protein A [Burkholderia gladioli]
MPTPCTPDLTLAPSQWVNFKLFGTTGAMFVFIILQSLWLAKYLKEDE